MSIDRRRIIALAPIAFLVLASCGGGDDSSTSGGNGTAKTATGATSTVRKTGASGATGAARNRPGPKSSPKERARSDSGGAAGPSPPSKADREARKRRIEREAKPDKGGSKKGGSNGQKKGGKDDQPATTGPASKPSSTPEVVLYNKAKRVCKALGVAALARRFKVKSTPDAVAAAYAATYPASLQTAVRDGCKAAFSG